MNSKIILLLFVIGLLPIIFDNSYAQITSGGFGQSPFERDFGDVKFLDAYFGTLDDKIEVEAGDSNVPFTVVFAKCRYSRYYWNSGTIIITIQFFSI